MLPKPVVINPDDLTAFFTPYLDAANNEIMNTAIEAMATEIIGSVVLGEALEASQLIKLGFILNPEFFANHYQEIFDALNNAGTFKSYEILIRALLGVNTEVSFDVPNAGHLRINIVEEVFERGLRSHALEGMETKSKLGELVTTASSHWAMQQILLALKNLETNGIYVEYNLTPDRPTL